MVAVLSRPQYLAGRSGANHRNVQGRIRRVLKANDATFWSISYAGREGQTTVGPRVARDRTQISDLKGHISHWAFKYRLTVFLADWPFQLPFGFKQLNIGPVRHKICSRRAYIKQARTGRTSGIHSTSLSHSHLDSLARTLTLWHILLNKLTPSRCCSPLHTSRDHHHPIIRGELSCKK